MPPRRRPAADSRRQLHPDDTRFDADVVRFRKIVQPEWADSHNERGWLDDELMDMARLSGDAFFTNE